MMNTNKANEYETRFGFCHSMGIAVFAAIAVFVIV